MSGECCDAIFTICLLSECPVDDVSLYLFMLVE